MKINKKIILSIIALGVLGLAYGYYLYNKPVSGLDNVRPDVEVSAKELIQFYQENEDRANQQYLDKIVAVHGTINNIESQNNELAVSLNTGDPLGSIICKIRDASTGNTLSIGEEVTIKGLCTGYLMDVLLVNSTIVN